MMQHIALFQNYLFSKLLLLLRIDSQASTGDTKLNQEQEEQNEHVL